MDGMLSQDEINALLNGMASGDTPPAEEAPQEADAPASDAPTPDTQTSGSASTADQSLLTESEKDAIGEVANISMGSSATTLYALVNRKVNITTPVVSLANWNDVVEDYERPCVFIKIKYTIGLEGTNILILREDDVKIITDLMMGGDGTNTEGELTDLHLSAICEAMNQMMGSSATSLSSMLGRMIDISPPEANLVDMTKGFDGGDDVSSFLNGTFVRINFRMQIGDLVDSIIMQLYPIDFAKSLYDYFMESQEPEPEPQPEPAPAPAMGPTPQQMPDMNMGSPMPDMNMGMGMGMTPPMGMPMGGMGMGVPMGMPMQQMAQPMPNVNVQNATFTPFSQDMSAMQATENISLIKDVPLEVTVELGRTSKVISDILDFSPGTIIELDKIAGEPVDVLVNGKLVAKGEVVVIEENFGVRVTEIIN